MKNYKRFSQILILVVMRLFVLFMIKGAICKIVLNVLRVSLTGRALIVQLTSFKCVKDGLEMNMIERLLDACRRLVAYFKHSTVATAALAERQKSMNIPIKNLLQDVSTRWNST